MKNNFKLINGDTDSITICKQDGSEFTKEEQFRIVEELNALLPEYIKFENDGYYPSFVVLKAKNYIMYDGKKIKLKGSSLKSSTLEPALKKMLNEIIEAIVFGNDCAIACIYERYVKAACTIKDITPWAKKITISTKTLESERANERKIIEALDRAGLSYSEGDRFYVYFKPDGELGVVDSFDGKYDEDVILQKLYKTTERFQEILPVDKIFKNFKLKKNKPMLDTLIGRKLNA